MNDCNRNQTIQELSKHYGFSLKDAMCKFGNNDEHKTYEERLAFFKNNIFSRLHPDSPLVIIRIICIAELFHYISNDRRLNVDYSLRIETEPLKDFYYYSMCDKVDNLLKEMIPTFQELYDVFRNDRNNIIVGRFIEEVAEEVAKLTDPH
jgi:hypothetical protein